MVMAAGPPVSQGRHERCAQVWRSWRLWLCRLVFGAAAAAADAGKVLVFTGTAGTANPATATAAAALQAAGTAGDYTVDVTSDATKIAAANLAGYRAVVFVNSAGDVLSAEQEAALQAYVQDGGGFVGIGETAKLEEGGNAFFDTLIGLTGASRTRRERRQLAGRRVPRPRAPGHARPRRARQGPQRQLLRVDEQPDRPGPHRRARALQHRQRRLGHQRRRAALHGQRQHAPAAAAARAVVVP